MIGKLKYGTLVDGISIGCNFFVQATADGVDVLSLSIAPGTPPDINAVYFNTIDVALLGAVRAGTFVVQAAGNNGPFFESILSFSPWIVSVAAGYMDRNYTNSITLGNGKTLSGDGLAGQFGTCCLGTLYLSH